MPNKYNIQAKRQELDGLIRDRAWNTFRNKYTKLSYPQDNKHNAQICKAIAECRNRHTTHRTLLHAVCDVQCGQPPADVIALIASSCTRSLFTQDSEQKLPLHIAILRGAGIDTIRALLESVPKDIDQYSKENMLLCQDSTGSTPLLLAVKMSASTNNDDIIKYLVNQDATGSSLIPPGNSRKKKHQKPVSVPLKYVAARETLYVDGGLESPQDLLHFILVKTFRAKLRHVMEKCYHSDRNCYVINENDDTKVCLSQAAILCYDLFGSSKLASSILSAIIRNELFHSQQRLNHHRDFGGNSTLHIACLSGITKYDQVLRLGQRQTSYGINSEDCTLMEYLIKSSMDSFTLFIARNDAGDIPLHCAIRTGKDCIHIRQLIEALEQSAMICTGNGELPIHLAIKSGSAQNVIILLWKAHPDAALIKDESTGMYLFQLASSSQIETRSLNHLSRKCKKQNLEKVADYTTELQQLSLSYFFLRERPEVISFFR
ncbi:hypothetical protein HJC23_012704 [Cyclotella cryptica]|uniref:Uncharacterized protein n=1 Tax=Cyclotella cryptica TaxID=29204 RepID=A0ABD3PN24_9STRA|eukprot:CCRYP_013346-RA/>CCRYP_013346-RA protein AED:0.07 eAED:0.07 QI:0/-1/0/1/-1/1/1/0/488